MRLSVIVPSSGRPSLGATLASATGQMEPGDELLVDVNDDGDWGGAARQRKMAVATGDALLFQDDDDVYAPGALSVVRRELEAAPSSPHVFRMRYQENGFVLWEDREVRAGNVASQMICVPNKQHQLGRWTGRYESDFDFLSATSELMGDPVWHEEVISLVHHPGLRADVSMGIVITTCAGRERNLARTLGCVASLDPGPVATIVVFDGCDAPRDLPPGVVGVRSEKHRPGLEQPRNAGFRVLRELCRATHCWFLDSDLVFAPGTLGAMRSMASARPAEVLLGPYDWLPAGGTQPDSALLNDPRWPAFDGRASASVVALGAGVSCFGGNIVWPAGLFEQLGGFDANLHHGRCEDGELGLRAVESGAAVTPAPEARAWHVPHPVDLDLVHERNRRDVPMILHRHPWIVDLGFRLVLLDGARLDWVCPRCDAQMNCHLMWGHDCA